MSEQNEIAEAIYDLSKSLRLLGGGNISRDDMTPGSIESLAMLIRDSNIQIADALTSIANAIHELAEAMGTSK
jgi:hypothetical protein